MKIRNFFPDSKTAACLLTAAALIFLSPVMAELAPVPTTPQWRLDIRQGSTEIRNFRADPQLRCSGSGQTSVLGLASLGKQLSPILKANEPVWIIDLRQESHGFLNGEAVSWHGPHNAANAGKDASAVEADETARLQAAIGHQTHSIPMGTSDLASGMKPFTALIHSATTERQEARRYGFGYIRIAATDMQWPEPQAVDAFLTFYRSLPKNPGWLHFHCHAGQGRTTTFMALYEMLCFPNRSLTGVLTHQKNIGGADLGTPGSRYDMLQKFHTYVQENYRTGFTLSWSSWLTQH